MQTDEEVHFMEANIFAYVKHQKLSDARAHIAKLFYKVIRTKSLVENKGILRGERWARKRE